MQYQKASLSNDQILISRLSSVISSHSSPRIKNLTDDFSFLLEYIYDHAENPVTLLYNIGIIIINQEYLIIKRNSLSRFLKYGKSTFSNFYQKNLFSRTDFESLSQYINISKLAKERHWLPYRIHTKSIFSDKLFHYHSFWANNDLIGKSLGGPSSISALLHSFCPSIADDMTELVVMA